MTESPPAKVVLLFCVSWRIGHFGLEILNYTDKLKLNRVLYKIEYIN